MARYEHLPIYRAAFDLAVHVEKLVRGFSRYLSLDEINAFIPEFFDPVQFSMRRAVPH